MKKLRYAGIAVIIIVAIVVTLINNKAKMQANVKKETKGAFYVSIVPAREMDLNEQISFTGTLAANNDVNLISETQGKVTAVFAKVGDYKPAGSVIAQVDDEVKKAAYQLAEANYQKAKKDYEKFKQLFEQKSTTEAQLDLAKIGYVNSETQYIMAKRQYNDTKITTPISGVLTSRTVDVGAMIQPGMSIGNIVDISRLKVKVNVAERDVVRLKNGDAVNVTTDVFPDRAFSGRIETISAKGDEAHTYPVEIGVSGEGRNLLKSGMFARVNFNTLSRKSALAIERVALLGSTRDAKVYVIENGTAKLRPVTVGSEFGKFVEITSGISAGEDVVVSGQNTILDGVRVTVLK